MVNASVGSIAWKAGTAAFALLAIGATLCAYDQYRSVGSLAAQLAVATADARRAHDETVALQTQLQDTKAQVGSEHQQLAAAQQQASAEEQRLTDVQQQVDAQQQQLQSTAERLAQESRPDLPIRLTFRNALLSQGMVAVFQNLSDTALELVIDVQSPVSGAHARRLLVINAHQVCAVRTFGRLAFCAGPGCDAPQL